MPDIYLEENRHYGSREDATADSRRRKLLHIFLVPFEIDEARKQQDHVPALVHDRAPAVGARDLARQLVSRGLLATVVPDQIMMPVGEVNVFLVEDGSPLKGGACEPGVSADVITTEQRAMTDRGAVDMSCSDSTWKRVAFHDSIDT